jgi:hypothetical protein
MFFLEEIRMMGVRVLGGKEWATVSNIHTYTYDDANRLKTISRENLRLTYLYMVNKGVQNFLIGHLFFLGRSRKPC